MSNVKQPAFDKAAASLARRMRTERQVRETLEGAGSRTRSRAEAHGADGAAAGYTREEIDDAIERLKDLGYIDDRNYAERFLEIQIDKKRGRRRVAEELRRHGIEARLADEVIAEGYPEDVERDNALALAEKILASLPDGLDRRKKAQKLNSRLVTQGYGYDIVNSVVGRLL
jgi:regulatory protein